MVTDASLTRFILLCGLRGLALVMRQSNSMLFALCACLLSLYLLHPPPPFLFVSPPPPHPPPCQCIQVSVSLLSHSLLLLMLSLSFLCFSFFSFLSLPPPPPQPPLSSQSVKSGVRFERSEWQLLLVEVKLRTFFGWNQGWTCDCRTWLIQYLCQHYRFLYIAFLYSCFLCCLLLQGNERQCHSVDNGRHERGVHGAAESDEAGAEDEPHQVHHQPGLHRPQQPAAPPPGGQWHHHHPGELLSAPAEPACAVSPKLLLTPCLRWSFVVDSTLKSENWLADSYWPL